MKNDNIKEAIKIIKAYKQTNELVFLESKLFQNIYKENIESNFFNKNKISINIDENLAEEIIDRSNLYNWGYLFENFSEKIKYEQKIYETSEESEYARSKYRADELYISDLFLKVFKKTQDCYNQDVIYNDLKKHTKMLLKYLDRIDANKNNLVGKLYFGETIDYIDEVDEMEKDIQLFDSNIDQIILKKEIKDEIIFVNR